MNKIKYCDICYSYKDFKLFKKQLQVMVKELECFGELYVGESINEQDKEFLQIIESFTIDYFSFEERKQLTIRPNILVTLMCPKLECVKMTQEDIAEIKNLEKEFLTNYMITFRKLKGSKNKKQDIYKLKSIIRMNYPAISDLFKNKKTNLK